MAQWHRWILTPHLQSAGAESICAAPTLAGTDTGTKLLDGSGWKHSALPQHFVHTQHNFSQVRCGLVIFTSGKYHTVFHIKTPRHRHAFMNWYLHVLDRKVLLSMLNSGVGSSFLHYFCKLFDVCVWISFSYNGQ